MPFLKALRKPQAEIIESIVYQFVEPYEVLLRNPTSDIITEDVLLDFGDILKAHHTFSREPFTKDKFEFALEKTLSDNGIPAELATRGNAGHDILIYNEPVSLKTQADGQTKPNKLVISKFMELGGADWGDNPDDLYNLMELYLNHLQKYERIFSLRCLNRGPHQWHYEIIEIPKSLLLEAKEGDLEMKTDSRQKGPKPGYCRVYSQLGSLKYQLYFDGGGEQKLRVLHLDTSLCTVHAQWKFKITPLNP